jgi:hypothetical protein
MRIEGAMLSFGLGGDQSGVPFHYHGPGWSETLHGLKRWFVQPNGVRPQFDPDRSTLQWYISINTSFHIPSSISSFNCFGNKGCMKYIHLSLQRNGHLNVSLVF